MQICNSSNRAERDLIPMLRLNPEDCAQNSRKKKPTVLLIEEVVDDNE